MVFGGKKKQKPGMVNPELGKSIQNVLKNTPKKGEKGSNGYIEIDLSLIRPPQENPRKSFDTKGLEELSESIAEHGIIQPIVVIRQGAAGYEIVSGERRYRASKLLNLAKVPVVIRTNDDEQQLSEIRLIENIQRADLNPLEVGLAYQKLINDYKLTQEELSKRVGKSRASIANAMRLLKLPEQLLDALADGSLTTGHAKAILGLDDDDARLSLGRQVIIKKLSVRETEELAKEGDRKSFTTTIQKGSAPTSEAKNSKAPELKELEGDMTRLFGRKIKIKFNEKTNKGSVTLNFASKSDFNDLYKQLQKVLVEKNGVLPEYE
ncbi:MAG: ParB/RepB/Spo0J family partition protein [Planctomycetes bacterium]|nr:ParB/RepB/Spo0J family partition protein [Planctomycetota bacterium]